LQQVHRDAVEDLVVAIQGGTLALARYLGPQFSCPTVD